MNRGTGTNVFENDDLVGFFFYCFWNLLINNFTEDTVLHVGISIKTWWGLDKSFYYFSQGEKLYFLTCPSFPFDFVSRFIQNNKSDGNPYQISVGKFFSGARLSIIPKNVNSGFSQFL